MDFVVKVGGTDPQHAHIVVYSCRGAFKISKITGSGPDLRPSAKNDENFKKSQKITFSKLVRGSFLHIPCALWELRSTSKSVFLPISNPLGHLIGCGSETPGEKKNFKNREILKFPNLFGNRFWTSPAHSEWCAILLTIFSHRFSSSNLSLIWLHSIQPKLKN